MGASGFDSAGKLALRRTWIVALEWIRLKIEPRISQVGLVVEGQCQAPLEIDRVQACLSVSVPL